MRINKYIAHSGLVSRRKADELVASGNVKVNGVVVKEAGFKVGASDVVSVNGRNIEIAEKKVYILLNKPTGYVTTMNDNKGRLTVADLVTDINERIFPVGRLDYNTSGLLLMTNDGDLAYKITHPRHEVTKTYRAEIEGYLSDTRLAKLRKGVDIGGFITSKAKVSVLKQFKNKALVEIEIHEGKNRQVRKMFKAVGCHVAALQRISIGDIRLGRMLEGHYRKLTPKEIEIIKGW